MRISSPSLMSPMAMPATGALMGTPASMSDRVPPQTLAIDDEPFDSRMSRDHADRVREVRLVRQHRLQGTLGERPVADLAAAGAAQELHLADTERREVVVQHELLVGVADERVDLLLVRRGAQRGHRQRLGLAAGEQRRAVRARQQADLAGDRPDVVQPAAVDALRGVDDHLADVGRT